MLSVSLVFIFQHLTLYKSKKGMFSIGMSFFLIVFSFNSAKEEAQRRGHRVPFSGCGWCLRVFTGDCVRTPTSEAYTSLEAPPPSAQCGTAPPHRLLFWNVYIVSCVFRRADIGPPIIGYPVVREKLLFIGPLSGASVSFGLRHF